MPTSVTSDLVTSRAVISRLVPSSQCLAVSSLTSLREWSSNSTTFSTKKPSTDVRDSSLQWDRSVSVSCTLLQDGAAHAFDLFLRA